MRLFSRREKPLFGDGASENSITVRDGEYTDPEQPESEESDEEDQQWEADVAELEGMTSTELFRDAAESVVEGDGWYEGSAEALEHYTRAGAVAQLAMVKAFQESGQDSSPLQ